MNLSPRPTDYHKHTHPIRIYALFVLTPEAVRSQMSVLQVYRFIH